MIERTSAEESPVLEFSATGRITAEDYETVIVPAIEAGLHERSKLRLLYHLGPSFEGFDAGAAWEDAKLGLEHPASWERIALVTDVEWLQVATRVIGFAMPGHVRVFENAAIDEARAWVAG